MGRKFRTISVPADCFPLMDDIKREMPGYGSYAGIIVDAIRRRHEAVMDKTKMNVMLADSKPADVVVNPQ
jgi:phosphoribosyl 1,2-cyclic phosphodiesterase